MATLAQQVIAFGIPATILITIALFIVLILVVYFNFKGSKRVDALEVMYKEQVEIAKINADPNLTTVYMVYADGSRPILKGRYRGHNKINLYTSSAELYQPNSAGDKYTFTIQGKDYEIPKNEWEIIHDKITDSGGFLHVVVYEPDRRFWEQSKDKAVLCLTRHVIYSPGDGRVILNMPGTESHGFYFEVPSGDRDLTMIISSAIQTMTWIRLLSMNQSNVFDVTNKALDINPALVQLLAGKSVDRPIQKVSNKDV